jgi:hypothetical protein
MECWWIELGSRGDEVMAAPAKNNAPTLHRVLDFTVFCVAFLT